MAASMEVFSLGPLPPRRHPWVPPIDGVRDVLDDSDDGINDNRPIHRVGDTDDEGDDEDGANGCSRDDSDDSVACMHPPTLPDKPRKGGRPTRKGQRPTSPRAGAAGSPVDLVTEQRGEEGATRKKASKGASGDPLDVDSGGSEQPAPKGKQKASVKTRKAESESESDTTHSLRSARRKVTPEQGKKLTEVSKSTCPDRIKERNAAFAAADEVSRKRVRQAVLAQEGVEGAKLLKRKKAKAKSAAVAARKAPPGTKKAAATLDPSAAKSKTSLNKAAPGTKKPAERAAPAAANLDSCKNDQANRLTASEKSFLKKLLAKQNGVESGDLEEDDDESVDDLEDARAEPHGDLESYDSQGAGDGKADEDEDSPLDHFRDCLAAALPWKKASLKVMREWRAALYRLRNTRIEGVNAAITTIQNDSKDGDGNTRGEPHADSQQVAPSACGRGCLCHDDTCCPETKLLKDAVKTHPIEADDTEEPVASAKPKSASGRVARPTYTLQLIAR
ncbi:unnamed protein product [Ectocarpus sp. CCAP 1310/34]|nr:unnamed protein product [Ectocarpus sp. CCAP 1310/34]